MIDTAMDDTANTTQPNPPPQTPQQSAYDSNKGLFILIGLLFAIVVVGVGFYFMYNNLQRSNNAATPQSSNQPQKLITTTPTSVQTQTDFVVASPEPTLDTSQNTKRKSDLQQLQNALQRYKSQKGSYPTEITTTPQMIAKEGADLCPFITPAYITSLPIDPIIEANSEVPVQTFKDCNTNYAVGYMVSRTGQNKITLTAPFADQQTISITF